ncbi:MAG: hypothetical protein NTZ24_14215 [Deltaproteobacteria bacterium]|nr:hypothetical protein [Deltaproteobacteria bacterium]
MQHDKILEQVMKMIDVSNKRMDLIMKGSENHNYERWEVEAAQREAEIQIKLLEKIIKNLNRDKDVIDATPKD